MKKSKTYASTGARRDRSKSPFWLNIFMLGGLVCTVTFGISLSYSNERTTSTQAEAAAAQVAPEAETERATGADEEKPTKDGNGASDTFFSRLFENRDLSADLSKPGAWRTILTKVPLRLMLAALLAAMIAYRPQKFLSSLPRNPYVAQTQILLAVVAAALMIIVADSAARAFGIFAAASLVRFRTGIRDPKEVTVMLVSLAIGLGTGVGHLALAVIFALFVLLLLWVLEHREPTQVFRALELRVRTLDVDKTHERLRELFLNHQIGAEIQALNRQDDDDPRGKIVYRVRVRMDFSTDKLSGELFSADRGNLDSIEWRQKKSISYFYR